ncbi:MAG: twin-arginine translocase TatA/TatE family subunit [Deltaproteobacteria bacterium HGW-Deltaproteobacteria-18]|nr:MAG: twin-arginine translocase TatA/TatE family subunit [Deltaproteobacteria bacterium HGW-Deltaproteobacteria-18]
MFGIGVQEMLVVLVIALIVFGGKNLPQIGSNMGRAIINFKKGISDASSNEEKPADIVEKTNKMKN